MQLFLYTFITLLPQLCKTLFDSVSVESLEYGLTYYYARRSRIVQDSLAAYQLIRYLVPIVIALYGVWQLAEVKEEDVGEEAK